MKHHVVVTVVVMVGITVGITTVTASSRLFGLC